MLALSLTGCTAPTPRLEVVAELSQAPGNIAVTPEGRLIISQHALYMPPHPVIELLPDGSTKPFPNEQWAVKPGKDGIGLTSVLGIQSDNGVEFSAGAGQPAADRLQKGFEPTGGICVSEKKGWITILRYGGAVHHLG